MSKIYNEIIIDMNPESPTFKETLYEDSFEYNGDMMLMQDVWASIKKQDHQGGYSYKNYKWTNGKWQQIDTTQTSPRGEVYDSFTNIPTPDTMEEREAFKESFVPKDISEIDLTGLSEDEATQKIAELKYGWVPGKPRSEQPYEGNIDWSQITKDLHESGQYNPAEFGAADIGRDDFVDAEGNVLDFQVIVNGLMDKFPDQDRSDVEAKVEEFLPKFEIDTSEEEAFAETQKTISEGEAGLTYADAGDVMAGATDEFGRAQDVYATAGIAEQRAQDQYGLGVSAAERAEGAATDVYGAAGDAYGAAGDAYGAAQQQLRLGERAAGRGLETGLGQLQAQAAQGMAQAQGGVSGAGRRGAVGAQATLAKGLGQQYGAFTDEQSRLAGAMGMAEGAMGRAGAAYGRAGSARERATGAYEDELTRLGQEKGYAEDIYGIAGGAMTRAEGALGRAEGKYARAGETYIDPVTGEEVSGTLGLAGERSDLAYDREMSRIGEGAEFDYDALIGDFITEAGFKQGGRVPSKKSFTDFLTQLPDAGGM